MKKIRITGIEGYYYIEEDALIYSCDDYDGDVEVSDLTELKISQYNELNNKLEKHYNYNLEGRFI